MCPYLEFFWSAFSRIRIEYRDLLCKSSHPIRMRESADQKNLEYEHFSRSDDVITWCLPICIRLEKLIFGELRGRP